MATFIVGGTSGFTFTASNRWLPGPITNDTSVVCQSEYFYYDVSFYAYFKRSFI
jgi:hypothetical protein